jgi:hypothetical protein
MRSKAWLAAPVLLAHANVTKNINILSMGPKLRYPTVRTMPCYITPHTSWKRITRQAKHICSRMTTGEREEKRSRASATLCRRGHVFKGQQSPHAADSRGRVTMQTAARRRLLRRTALRALSVRVPGWNADFTICLNTKLLLLLRKAVDMVSKFAIPRSAGSICPQSQARAPTRKHKSSAVLMSLHLPQNFAMLWS